VSRGVESPGIGLVTDSDINRFALQKLLREQRYRLVVSLDSQRLAQYLKSPPPEPEPDVWLVDISESVCQDAFDSLLDNGNRVVLVNDEKSPDISGLGHKLWCRRLLDKLELLAVNGERDAAPGSAPEQVWILAASLGGPKAISQFVAALPSGLPIAMIYAQHIEPKFDSWLEALGQNSSYNMRLAGGEQQLRAGEILVVPADYQLRFQAFGRVVKTHRPWQGQYQPAIDQVAAELAGIYRHKLGMIVFTGTCNDGEVGARMVKAAGGEVWVQSPESCVSPEMPNAALTTGCVSRRGSPEELAGVLSSRYRMQGRQGTSCTREHL